MSLKGSHAHQSSTLENTTIHKAICPSVEKYNMYNRLVQATQINAKEPFPCSILEYNRTQMHLAENGSMRPLRSEKEED